MHQEINVTYKIYGRAALLVSFFKVILKIKPHFPQGGRQAVTVTNVPVYHGAAHMGVHTACADIERQGGASGAAHVAG